MLLGLALKRAGHADEAIGPLEQAARVMPSPVRSFAWSELAECYRNVGSEESLGGEKSYELRIALPFGEINIGTTEPTAEAV